jgi:hypothetical protein
MVKRVALCLVMLGFIALASPARNAIRNMPELQPTPAGPYLDLTRAHVRRESPLVAWLSRLDRLLERAKPQENALASLLEADKPEDVREIEERQTRRKETAAHSRSV